MFLVPLLASAGSPDAGLKRSLTPVAVTAYILLTLPDVSGLRTKNPFLSPRKNPLRKVREYLIARRLEKALSKERIFTLYLNPPYALRVPLFRAIVIAARPAI